MKRKNYDVNGNWKPEMTLEEKRDYFNCVLDLVMFLTIKTARSYRVGFRVSEDMKQYVCLRVWEEMLADGNKPEFTMMTAITNCVKWAVLDYLNDERCHQSGLAVSKTSFRRAKVAFEADGVDKLDYAYRNALSTSKSMEEALEHAQSSPEEHASPAILRAIEHQDEYPMYEEEVSEKFKTLLSTLEPFELEAIIWFDGCAKKHTVTETVEHFGCKYTTAKARRDSAIKKLRKSDCYSELFSMAH